MNLLLLSAWLIVPGHQVGSVRIGDSGAVVRAKLGPSTDGDAAMGHFWSTWTKGDRHVDVYSVRGEANEDHAVLIRVDSPSFHTVGGLRVGSPERVAVRSFPGLKRVASYLPNGVRPPVIVLDDSKHGLAVEVRQGKVVAIGAHRRGMSVQGYIPLTAVVANRSAPKGQ